MNPMTMTRFLSFLALFCLALPVQAAAPRKAPVAHRAAPADWTKTIVATPEGGVRMGNPQAKVKLVEYMSYTCPHCAHFASEGLPVIVQAYVKTGQVSVEMRSALRDRLDLVAAQVARCGGPAHMIEASEAIFADQEKWIQKGVDWDNAHQADFNGAAGAGAMLALADGSGLSAIVAQHGIPAAALTKCLGDAKLMATLEASTNDAFNVRKISGTPAFLLNDTYLDKVFTWADLEPKLQAAVKG